MKRFKNLFFGILIGMLIMLPLTTYGDSILQQINVIFNGINVQVEGQPVEVNSILYNGTTYLPMRKVAELVGKDVDWDNNTRTANIIEKKDSDINLSENVEYKNITIDDKKYNVIENKDNNRIYSIIVEGNEYYTPVYINSLIYTINQEIWIRYNLEEDKLYLAKHKSNIGIEIDEILILDISFIRYNNIAYISKDYYKNTILPLLK